MAGEVSQSDPYRGASNLAGCSGSEPVKPRNRPPAWNGLRECWECRAGGHSAKANVGIEVLENIDVGLTVVGEGGMSGRNEQRKLGTTRGSPRRSRTAKASRISRAGDKPAGAKVRRPVVWIAGSRETKILKPIDRVSLGETTPPWWATTPPPQRPSLGSGLFCPGPSSLNRRHYEQKGPLAPREPS